MEPIKTDASDTKFVGGPGVEDLYVETALELNPEDGHAVTRLRSRWRPSAEERMKIALGADIVLDVMGSRLPPVRVLATEPPIDRPFLVFEAVDEILELGTAWSLSATLEEAGIPKDPAEVKGWSLEDKKEVAAYLAALGEGETPELPELLR